MTRQDGSSSTDNVWPINAPAIRLILTVVAFVLIDRGSQLVARGSGADVDSLSLIGAALVRNPLVFTAAAVAAAGAAVVGRSRIWGGWQQLEQGATLRLCTVLLIGILVWRFALYDYNWYAGRLHIFDRGLVVVLGLLALRKPVALLPFVVVVRVVSDHFTSPLSSSSAVNIRDFTILAVALIAAVVLLWILTAEARTDAAPLLLAAVVVSHFWAGGLRKLRMNWLFDNDLSELPRNAYAQGWLGHTNGSFARSLGDVLDNWGWLVMIVVLGFELGAALALLRRSSFRWWLLCAPLFHLATFALLGYVFVDWILAEIAILLLVTKGDREWLARAWEKRRALVVVGVVVLAPAGLLFHPPRLAWFDTQVVYSYEIEAVTDQGAVLAVAPLDFSPHVEQFAFSTLGIGPREPVVSAYGAASKGTQSLVAHIVTIADLEELEGAQQPVDKDRVELVTHVLARFIEYSHEGEALWFPSLPNEFQATRAGLAYENEPIAELRVTQVTIVRSDSGNESRRELALVVARE